MTIVQEIADALALVSGVVNNTRSLVRAVNDGREYLQRNFKEAGPDFAELLQQMEITVVGLAKATGVVSGFRFTVGSEAAAEEDLRTFNRYVVDQRNVVASLRGEIRTLKADCDKIRELRDGLNARLDRTSWSAMFGLLGIKAGQGRDELASTISNFYADDLRMILAIEQILHLAETALTDVDQSLGEAGVARPYNVPRAARMLGAYSVMFREPEQELNDLVDKLHEAVRELRV